jgi:hypothetical protein
MYRIFTVDGTEAAEKWLNDSVAEGAVLVHSQVETIRDIPEGEQQNTMLAVPVTRFIFIFNTPAP